MVAQVNELSAQLTMSAQVTTPSTRDRLVEAAMELFYLQGYEATSIAEILERADVNSGSLYHFFRGKEDLLLAVLERYKDMLWPAVIEPAFRRTSDSIERIFSVLDGYRQGLVFTHFTAGCPIGNLALELREAHRQAREKIAENFEGWRAAIRKCLQEAAHQLPPNVECDKLATFILTVMEGGVMQSRAHGSIAPFDACVEQLRTYFDLLLRAAPGTEGGSNERKRAT
jgi:AcrR family transcriptional regulator